MWGGLYTAVCTVHTECTRQNRFSATPTARPTGFAVDVGDQDSRGHRRARAKYLKTENVWGVEEYAATKVSLRLQHFILLFGHCNCLLLGCLWAQHLCYFRQGSTWTNTAPTRFNVGLLVKAGDGGGGALVPGSGSWTLFLFFSALWGKATSR